MAIGSPRSFDKKFKFRCEIDGFETSAFQKCSEIKVAIAITEYSEGGTLIPNKSPGRATVENVTLSRGATRDQDAYDWFNTVADLAANTGLVDNDYKRTPDIVQQDRDGTTLKRWRLNNAWPTEFSGGDWDNEADEVVIQSLVLAYDYPTLINLAR